MELSLLLDQELIPCYIAFSWAGCELTFTSIAGAYILWFAWCCFGNGSCFTYCKFCSWPYYTIIAVLVCYAALLTNFLVSSQLVIHDDDARYWFLWYMIFVIAGLQCCYKIEFGKCRLYCMFLSRLGGSFDDVLSCRAISKHVQSNSNGIPPDQFHSWFWSLCSIVVHHCHFTFEVHDIVPTSFAGLAFVVAAWLGLRV